MPLRKDDAHPGLIILEGVVSIEETDQLLAWLQEDPMPGLDLSGCEHLHTAALQTLLALKPSIAVPPQDPFWRRCLQLNE